MNAAQERHVRLWCTTKLTNATAEHLDVTVLRKDFIKEQPSNTYEGLDVATFMDIIKKSDFAECLVPGMRLDLKIFKGITAPVAPPVVVPAPVVAPSKLHGCKLREKDFQVDLLDPNDHKKVYPTLFINDKFYCEAKPSDEFQVRVKYCASHSHDFKESILAICKVDELEEVSQWMDMKRGILCTIFPQKFRLAPANLSAYDPDDYVPAGVGLPYTPPQMGVVSVDIDVYVEEESEASSEEDEDSDSDWEAEESAAGHPAAASSVKAAVAPGQTKKNIQAAARAKAAARAQAKAAASAQAAAAPADPEPTVHANPPVLRDADTKFYLQPNLRCEAVKEPLSAPRVKRTRTDTAGNSTSGGSDSILVVFQCKLVHIDIFIQDARTIKVLSAQQELAKRNEESRTAGLWALNEGAAKGGVDIIEPPPD